MWKHIKSLQIWTYLLVMHYHFSETNWVSKFILNSLCFCSQCNCCLCSALRCYYKTQLQFTSTFTIVHQVLGKLSQIIYPLPESFTSLYSFKSFKKSIWKVLVFLLDKDADRSLQQESHKAKTNLVSHTAIHFRSTNPFVVVSSRQKSKQKEIRWHLPTEFSYFSAEMVTGYTA